VRCTLASHLAFSWGLISSHEARLGPSPSSGCLLARSPPPLPDQLAAAPVSGARHLQRPPCRVGDTGDPSSPFPPLCLPQTWPTAAQVGVPLPPVPTVPHPLPSLLPPCSTSVPRPKAQPAHADRRSTAFSLVAGVCPAGGWRGRTWCPAPPARALGSSFIRVVSSSGGSPRPPSASNDADRAAGTRRPLMPHAVRR